MKRWKGSEKNNLIKAGKATIKLTIDGVLDAEFKEQHSL